LCFNRWLENLHVANTSLTLLPHVREYCKQAALDKTEPKKHEGYQYVSNSVNTDILLKAKHLFWISLAQDFQPFLSMYQANKPLIPFLASDLEKLLRTVMNRFMKESVITSAKTFTQLVKVDISLDKNRRLCKELDVGIVTRREMNELKQKGKLSNEEKKHFEFDCKAFLTRTTLKLLEKCPLKFPMVRFLRCLDPQVIGGAASTSVRLFERLLSSLLDARMVSETEVDLLKREYAPFVQDVHGNPRTLLQFQEYNVCGESVGSFLAFYLKVHLTPVRLF